MIGDWNTALIQISGALDRKLEVEQTAEILKAANAVVCSITVKIPGQTPLKIAAQALTLGSIVIEPYKKTFYTDPEEAFYMVPQQMVLSLPAELSNLWMITDDTNEYMRRLLAQVGKH